MMAQNAATQYIHLVSSNLFQELDSARSASQHAGFFLGDFWWDDAKPFGTEQILRKGFIWAWFNLAFWVKTGERKFLQPGQWFSV
jgi:hypothetical protein